MKILRNIMIVIAFILTNTACWNVGYNYAHTLCMIEHGGFSAPASIAYLTAIPNAIGVIICVVIAIIAHKRINKTGSK